MPASPSAAPRSVRSDARTFLLDGQAEVFLSAGIHYFRVPRALWADRIAKAKRGGMNTVETYVAWNVHEPEPGAFDFSGDRDLDAFLTECERQGMYAIVRPGPYICAEWDFGGFPAWLANVPGLRVRSMNRPYLDCVDRYFDAVGPIIARHQWTRGGGVVLVQVENEYANLRWTRGKEMPTDDDYQRYVRDALMARGIDVPLVTCVGHCAGTVECVNGHNPADLMPAQRERFPDAPLFSTEFWTGWYDLWGGPHHTVPARDVEYASWRCWAEAACGYNYYVYHGGTNFGYTAMCGGTTSYDYDAQVSETGRLTDKWRACRRVALFARTFKDILLTGEHRRDVRVYGDEGLRAAEIKTKERGGILFLDNPDAEKSATGSVPPYLPDVTLAPRTVFPYVHDVPLGWSQSGRYLEAYAGLVKSDAPVLTAHVRPDPFEGVRVFVYGTPGETREVALFHGAERGQGVAVTFAEEPRVYPAGFSQIVALSTELAGRTWFSDTDGERAPVLFGPDDVRDHGETSATVEVAPGCAHTLWALDAEGGLTEINVEAPPLPAPPALVAWETAAEPDHPAPDFDDSDWVEIDEPTSMLALGNGSNPYGWYRTTFESPDAGGATLHFAACSDRLTVWVNGKRVGSSGVPPEERKTDWTAVFEVEVVAGRNHVCVLADNLGLVKGDWNIGKGQENEKKGIYGPVTVTLPGTCYLIDLARWRFQGKLYGEREGWFGPHPPAPSPNSGRGRESVRWHRAAFTLDAVPESATPLLARLDGMGKGVLWLNGRNLGRYWQVGPQRDYYLPEPWLRAGENVLVLAETEGNMPEQVSLIWDARSCALLRVALG